MKQIITICVLALGMCSINGNAQTKKRTPVKTKTTTSTITKTREVGSDGFIWYRLKKGKMYGAQDVEGKVIVPIQYSLVNYSSSEWDGTHFFFVKNGDFCSVYTREGKCVIPIDRHFTGITPSSQKGYICWLVKKNGTTPGVLDAVGSEIIPPGKYANVSLYEKDKIFYFHVGDGNNVGICDLNGNEIISPNRGYTQCQPWEIYGTSDYYFGIKKGSYEGVCDLNGKELIAPDKYEYIDMGVYSEGSKTLTVKRIGSSDFEHNISRPFVNQGYNVYKTEKSKYNYKPYDNLYYAFKDPSRVSTSHSSNTSSTNSSSYSASSCNSSSNNTGGGTTTIVVEHQHSPQPMQEWQQCTSCWGSGNCRNCAGSGTNYIGSSLKRCSMCGGSGRCTTCSGQGGKNIIVYR